MTTIPVDNRILVEKPDERQLAELNVRSWPVWSKESSTFDWYYENTEVCFFLEGLVVVNTDQGERTIKAGDLVTFPKGLSCTWHVEEPVRKHYQFQD